MTIVHYCTLKKRSLSWQPMFSMQPPHVPRAVKKSPVQSSNSIFSFLLSPFRPNLKKMESLAVHFLVYTGLLLKKSLFLKCRGGGNVSTRFVDFSVTLASCAAFALSWSFNICRYFYNSFRLLGLWRRIWHMVRVSRISYYIK